MARGRGVDNYFSTFHLAAKYMFTHLHITRPFFTTHPPHHTPSNTMPAGACNCCYQPILRHSPSSSSFPVAKISALDMTSFKYVWASTPEPIFLSWKLTYNFEPLRWHTASCSCQLQLQFSATLAS